MPVQVRLTVVPLHRGDLRITGICYSISNVVRGRMEFKVCCCMRAQALGITILKEYGSISHLNSTAPGQAPPRYQTAAVAQDVCR